ncbi:hypothetical protein MK131_12410 [Candidatus Poribacteria bacterium]|nr:hypothetical protein [Candidatus Poribacteria bacterium]
MERNKRLFAILPLLVGLFCVTITLAHSQQKFSSLIGTNSVSPVNSTSTLIVPYIVWGGEAALFYANGGLQTKPGSIMAQQGLTLKLVPGDDFVGQVKNYLDGRTPFLRGTFRMLGQASEVIGRDPKTKAVVFGQMTWSAGDHFVARSNIKRISDLRGKKIAIQTGGPHVGMLYDMLRTARLSKADIDLIWVDDLTGAEGPAEAFRKDPKIAGCFVITPDMIGLTGGYDNTGTGAEGTVDDARVVVSTATLSRSIADVYACRKDFYDSNKSTIEKFFAGYLKGVEVVMQLKKDYENSGSQEYMKLLQMIQDIYGPDIIPTLEEDAHGLIADCTYVGQPGNVSFFNDQTNVVTGFSGFNKSAIDMATSWGFAEKRYNLLPSDLNFSSSIFTSLLSNTVRMPVQRKRFKKETVRAEVEAFNEEDVLDEKTLVSFTIQFKPNQEKFSQTEYKEEFDRVVELAAKYGNAAVAIKGHTDPSKTLMTLVKTGIKRNIIKRTGQRGNYKYFMDGKSIRLEDTEKLIKLIQQKKFESGTEIESPYQVMRAGLELSEQRAEAVKNAIVNYARKRNVRLESDQIVPIGMGIKEPVIAKPTNPEQASENRRVEFALVKVSAETVAEADFDF